MFYKNVASDLEITVSFDEIPKDEVLRAWIINVLQDYIINKNRHIITMCAEHYLQKHVDDGFIYQIVMNSSDKLHVVVSEKKLVL
jgi:hypothetical protein